MKDIIMEKFGKTNPISSCLDKGYVQLIDCMPRYIEDEESTADYVIAEAARCSYQRNIKTINDDKVLIRYLMRHNHTSPFEMIEFKFHIKLPMYICTQLLRHRTASMNILSGRYSEMSEEFYILSVDNVRLQDNINKQGSKGLMDNELSEEIIDNINKIHDISYEQYKNNLEKGLAREQARGILPYDLYTEMYWKIDLKNLLHFLDLRCDNHSQWEMQQYANTILELIKPIVSWTIEAWEDYSPYRGGVLLTRCEVDALKAMFSKDYVTSINFSSKLERMEWNEKVKKMGIET